MSLFFINSSFAGFNSPESCRFTGNFFAKVLTHFATHAIAGFATAQIAACSRDSLPSVCIPDSPHSIAHLVANHPILDMVGNTEAILAAHGIFETSHVAHPAIPVPSGAVAASQATIQVAHPSFAAVDSVSYHAGAHTSITPCLISFQ